MVKQALIPQLGFRTSVVTYDRAERFAGSSKYPLSKMFALAFEGVTSFSTRPLRMVTLLGSGVSIIAMMLTLWAILASLVLESTIPGWASTVRPIYPICGVQMLCLGVIGEYIGEIYLETKRRPRAHIETLVHPSSGALGQPTMRQDMTASPDGLQVDRCGPYEVSLCPI